VDVFAPTRAKKPAKRARKKASLGAIRDPSSRGHRLGAIRVGGGTPRVARSLRLQAELQANSL